MQPCAKVADEGAQRGAAAADGRAAANGLKSTAASSTTAACSFLCASISIVSPRASCCLLHCLLCAHLAAATAMFGAA